MELFFLTSWPKTPKGFVSPRWSSAERSRGVAMRYKALHGPEGLGEVVGAHLADSDILGVPPKWMVKLMETPINPWMIWGYPYFRKHPYINVERCGTFCHPNYIIYIELDKDVISKKSLSVDLNVMYIVIHKVLMKVLLGHMLHPKNSTKGCAC